MKRQNHGRANRTTVQRAWVWTSFQTVNVDEKDGHHRYTVFQKEQCPETGRFHLQGYSEFSQPVSGTWLQKFLGNKVHFEKRKGTRQEARDYCMKMETRVQGEAPKEFGKWNDKGQGNRTDLDSACEFLKSHSMRETAMEYPAHFVKFHRGLSMWEAILDSNEYKNNWTNVEVDVLLGPTGLGKSRKARSMDQRPFHMLYQGMRTSSTWFDGYVDQKVLIIEDFDGWLSYRELLVLTDGYDCRVHIKGGTVKKAWDHVIITCNIPPEEWYPKERDVDPLLRRINNTLTFGK